MPFEKAVFAGGHFWYMQEVFEKLPGVKEVIAGYTGGNTKNPTHEQVLSGATGHYEAVMVIYDSKKIPYKKCLNVFWKNIDPTDYRGQFADRGTQYRTAIFYLNKEQKRLAFKSKEEIEKSDIFLEPIATEILKASPFYPAEEYHQGYYKKCPMRYRTYKFHSGRGKLLKKLWKKR